MNRSSLFPPLTLACAIALAPAAAAQDAGNLECTGVTYVSASWSDAAPSPWRLVQEPGRGEAFVRPRLVWVDPASNMYHCRGDPAYGKSRNGEYMSEDDAKANGARALHGRKCG